MLGRYTLSRPIRELGLVSTIRSPFSSRPISVTTNPWGSSTGSWSSLQKTLWIRSNVHPILVAAALPQVAIDKIEKVIFALRGTRSWDTTVMYDQIRAQGATESVIASIKEVVAGHPVSVATEQPTGGLVTTGTTVDTAVVESVVTQSAQDGAQTQGPAQYPQLPDDASAVTDSPVVEEDFTPSSVQIPDQPISDDTRAFDDALWSESNAEGPEPQQYQVTTGQEAQEIAYAEAQGQAAAAKQEKQKKVLRGAGIAAGIAAGVAAIIAAIRR